MRVHSAVYYCLLVIVGVSNSVQGQSDCKVYPSKITEFYVGDCKKGLAHGNGKAEG